MDELAKTEARNYLSAAGFFIFAAESLLYLISYFTGTISEFSPAIEISAGVGMLIIAALLFILRKRDLIGILFVMLGFMDLFWANFGGDQFQVLLSIFAILVAVVTLTSKDKQKWLLFPIPVLLLFPGVPYVIGTLLSLYYALVCASEKINLPGRKLLTADEETDFKASGSVLGYMLFGLTMAAWAIFNLFGESYGFTFEALQMLEFICAVLMVFVSILLFAVGKMRFTPVMFLLIAMVTLFGNFSTGAMSIGIGVLFLLIGIFAILRKESRILPGIMLILSSVVYFILGGVGFGIPTIAVGIVEFVVAAISVYLAFVVYSQKKLPKF